MVAMILSWLVVGFFSCIILQINDVKQGLRYTKFKTFYQMLIGTFGGFLTALCILDIYLPDKKEDEF